MKQGEIGDSFYVVLTGQAKVVANERTLNRLLPGDHFGEISLLDGGPRSASVVAETEMTLVIITQKDFLAMLPRIPRSPSACWKAWLEPSAGSTARSPGSLPYVKVELHRPGRTRRRRRHGRVDRRRSRSIDTQDDILRATLQKVFRRTPVVVDDASYRRMGTAGAVLIQPGDLEWFRAVAQTRVPAEAGLAARFVPGVTEGGFDPAAGYRTFEEQIERLTT